jgi:hypothetical protein
MNTINALIRFICCATLLTECAYSHQLRPVEFQFGGGL